MATPKKDPLLEEGLKFIHSTQVNYVIDFLKTGEFKNQNAKNYIEAYT